MSHKIITISREFGSGGKYIGERVAEKLGIPYYDSVIMERIAEETGFVKDFVAQVAEYAPSKSIFSYAFVGRNTAGESLEDYVQKVQRKIIIGIEEHDNFAASMVNTCITGRRQPTVGFVNNFNSMIFQRKCTKNVKRIISAAIVYTDNLNIIQSLINAAVQTSA